MKVPVEIQINLSLKKKEIEKKLRNSVEENQLKNLRKDIQLLRIILTITT